MQNDDAATDATRATELLQAVSSGHAEAGRDFAPLLYRELRRVASQLLQGERQDHTLQATALVHEAWLRLVNVDVLEGADCDPEEARRVFLSLAASAMRRVLVDHARRKNTLKRGGQRAQVADLGDGLAVMQADAATLLDLESALQDLAKNNERLARVAELRIFAGLSLRELAEVVGRSLTTVKQDWAFARAVLADALRADG